MNNKNNIYVRNDEIQKKVFNAVKQTRKIKSK